MKLTTRPVLPRIPDLSLRRATNATANDTGGTNTMEIPTRNPPGVLHPKPGTPNTCSGASNQGDRASTKLVISSLFDLIRWYSFLIAGE